MHAKPVTKKGRSVRIGSSSVLVTPLLLTGVSLFCIGAAFADDMVASSALPNAATVIVGSSSDLMDEPSGAATGDVKPSVPPPQMGAVVKKVLDAASQPVATPKNVAVISPPKSEAQAAKPEVTAAAPAVVAVPAPSEAVAAKSNIPASESGKSDAVKSGVVPVAPVEAPKPEVTAAAPAVVAAPAPSEAGAAKPNIVTPDVVQADAVKPDVATAVVASASSDASVPVVAKAAELAKPVKPAKSGKAAAEKVLAKKEAASKGEAKKDDEDSGASFSGGGYLRDLTGGSGTIALAALDPAYAPDVVSPISLSEAVAIALQNNYSVLASAAALKGAWYDKIGAYGEYTPSLEFDVAKGTERSRPGSVNDIFGNRVLDTTHPRTDRNLTIRQPLIDLGVISDIFRAHETESIVEEDTRDVREGTANDTVNAYLKIMQSHASVYLANQYKDYLDDLAERMKVRVDGGGAPKADLERIKGRITTAESAKIAALGDLRTNLSEFKRLAKVVPAAITIPDVLAPPVPDDIQTAFDRAVKSNPSYLSSVHKIDVAASDRNKTITGYVPKVSLQYAQNYSYDAGGAKNGNPADGVYPVQKTSSLMVVASWALNGATPIAATMSGVEKESEMRLKSQEVRARLEEAIRTSFEGVNAAHQRIDVLRKAVKADTRVVKDFEEQYKSGGRSLFDVLDAYEQLYNARLNLMRVVIAEAQARFQVRRQMGEFIDGVVATEKP